MLIITTINNITAAAAVMMMIMIMIIRLLPSNNPINEVISNISSVFSAFVWFEGVIIK